jgi:DNA adenine methylase
MLRKMYGERTPLSFIGRQKVVYHKPMKSLVSYYGGKQRLAHKIVPLIPKHTVYCEPFCGGAAVLFRKPWPEVTRKTHYREVINDIDGRLTNLYSVIQTRFAEFVPIVTGTLYSEEAYSKAKFILKGNIVTDDLWRAWAYYVNINQSFAGKLLGGWGRSVLSSNLGENWSRRLEGLHLFADRLKSVQVSCTDALKCIGQFDSPQTFFYCDPPYVNTWQGHYVGYTEQQFSDLVGVLDSIQGSFLLSTYLVVDVPIPTDWEVFNFMLSCRTARASRVDRSRVYTKIELGNGARTELVYRKFSVEPRPEIKKLYASGQFEDA